MAVAAGSVFTQTALRGAGSGGLTTLNVAAGSVALLALLAAGAWLVREGYRRNHPTLEP